MNTATSTLGTPGLLNNAEAAEYIGVAPQTLTIWRCVKRYNIPFVKVGSGVRYRKEDLDAWLASRTVGASQKVNTSQKSCDMNLIGYKELRRKLGGDEGPCRRTIERMVLRGEFVRPVQVSPGRLMFVEAEVDAWIESRKLGMDLV